MDRKSTLIICLTIILIAILGAIYYISYVQPPKMETMNLNTASIEVPVKVDFDKIDDGNIFLNSSEGYFVAEIVGNITFEEIQSQFKLKNSDIISQKGTSSQNTSQITIYKISENKFVGVYVDNNVFIVIIAPNFSVLNEMLNSINPFNNISIPIVSSDNLENEIVLPDSEVYDTYIESDDDEFVILDDDETYDY